MPFIEGFAPTYFYYEIYPSPLHVLTKGHAHRYLSKKKKKTQIPNFELKRHVSYMDCGAFRLHNKFFFQNNFFKVYNHKLLKFTYTLFIGFYF